MSGSIQVKLGLVGRYKLAVIKPDGSIEEGEFFPNLITDYGLNQIGIQQTSGNLLTYCRVGSGNSTPLVSQTSLDNQINTQNASENYVGGFYSPGPPATYTSRSQYTFPMGAVVGNVTEIGVSAWQTGNNLFSRALVIDSLGNPTSITVLADEQLRVTYELISYLPTEDINTTVVLAGVTYDVLIRPSNYDSYWTFGSSSGISLDQVGAYNSSAVLNPAGQPVTGSYFSGNAFNAGYINNSFSRTSTASFSISNGNIGGIKIIYLGGGYRGGMGNWKLQFTPVIPKDGTNTLAINFSYSWART